MRVEWERRFLDMAKLVSTWSKDPGTKVGAVIVRQDRTVVSIGYNGFPRTMDDSLLLETHCECPAREGGGYPCHCHERRREEKLSRTIHAEINALLTAKVDVAGCTMFTYPFLSCERCFVQLVQAGITEFIAPKSDPIKYERWQQSFRKVRAYCAEIQHRSGRVIRVAEVPYE